MYARDASNRANSWAAQRGQAIEKAKQLREERKFNLAKAGEMSVANEMGPNNFGRITSPDVQQRTYQNPMASDYSQRKPATMTYGMTNQYGYEPQQDLNQAKNSLMLLKSKMKNTGYDNASGYPEKEYEKPRGYQTTDSYQYADYNKGGNVRGGQDRNYNNYNDNYQQDNNNYRRVFKPTFGDQPTYSQGNQGYSKGNTYSNSNYNYEDRGMYKNDRASPFGGASNNEYQNYQSQNYPSTQQPYRQQQSLGVNKYSAPKDPYQQHPASYDDFPSYQSKNISSRGKTNMDRGNAYDNGYDSQYSSQPKYGQKNQMEDEYPPNKNYYGKAYEPPQQKTTPNNLLQRNKGYEQNTQKPSANKGWQNSNEYEDDDRNSYQAKPKPQPQANTRKNGLPQPGPRQKRGGTNFGTVEDDRPIKGGNDDLPPEYANTGPLEECPYGCGRSFAAEALEKHANICQKVFQSKRKKFDTAQQRMTEDQAKIGYENKYNPKRAAQKKPTAPQKSGKASNIPKWKQESEIFRANLKAARGQKLSQKEEAQVAQAAQASSDMMVQCHSCGRRFNDVAAARHIPHCESKQHVRNPVKAGKNRRY